MHTLLSIFISSSLRVSGILYAHYQENLLYLRDIGICHSVWMAVRSAGCTFQPADRTAIHTE